MGRRTDHEFEGLKISVFEMGDGYYHAVAKVGDLHYGIRANPAGDWTWMANDSDVMDEGREPMQLVWPPSELRESLVRAIRLTHDEYKG
jgi:hypothetical protein